MSILRDTISKNRDGRSLGIPCFCTANEHAIKASLNYAAKKNVAIAIEATCNQVNQEGGYTGMTPQTFMFWVSEMANECGLDKNLLIFGGDHLGPTPWRHLSVEDAMQKARYLVKNFVEAGFTKIHIDTSIACGGEPTPSFEQISERAADLCAVAEKCAPDPKKLHYIIGTEVPIPGGETEEPGILDVTSVNSLIDTINTHQDAWNKLGLENAWQRIVGVVTQPGVDFGHTSIYPYDAKKTVGLRDTILRHPDLVFEAHSTDYQTTEALTALVKNHFMFLKVGPELTFRFREAVFAIAKIHSELTESSPGEFEAFIDQKMLDKPKFWKAYYSGTEKEQLLLRKFSYSDRIRYYWTSTEVTNLLDNLLNSEVLQNIPQSIVSQHFMSYEFGSIPTNPLDLIEDHIAKCVARYYRAAGIL